MTSLKAVDIIAGYPNKKVIEKLSLSVPKNSIVSLIGPNGSGKTTLLKALARIITPETGIIYLDEKNIKELKTKLIAQKIALLAQTTSSIEGVKVREIVSYGRFPYQKSFQGLSTNDYELIDWALEATQLTELQNQFIDNLSGGQQQRVWLAMALAQDTEFLILDEPITYLDPAHQLEILMLLQKINQQAQKTILMTIHDLNHAARFSDYIFGMKAGNLIVEGTPEEVYTKDNLAKLFNIDATVECDPISKKPLLLTYDLLKGAD